MEEPHQRLKWARERQKFPTATAAAERFGWNINTYRSHENGSRALSRQAAARYGKAFRVPVGWLLTNEGSPNAGKQEVPPSGIVGDGARISGFAESGPDFGSITLPPGAPPDTQVLIVRGNAMYPRYFEGEHLFYTPARQPPEQLIDRECVIKLASGETVVRVIRRGARRGRFTLESFNAPPLLDQEIEWAAPVRWRG